MVGQGAANLNQASWAQVPRARTLCWSPSLEKGLDLIFRDRKDDIDCHAESNRLACFIWRDLDQLISPYGILAHMNRSYWHLLGTNPPVEELSY
jgi:hypothetical protein